MNRKAGVTSAIVLVVLTAMFAAGAISAAAGQDPGRGRWDGGNRLAGTWNVTVNRPPPLTPLKSLQVFTDDGGVIEMANEWPATRTASYGVWEPVEGRLYAATSVFFRFDPQTGAYLGTTKITRTIELAPDGKTFTLVGRFSLLDAAGNVVAANLRTAGTGERMQVERIADRP